MLNLYPASAHNVYAGQALTFQPHVEAAAKAIHEATDGMGTNEKALIKTLGELNAEDRYQLAACYKKLFNESLKDVLHEETSGHFRKLLEVLSVPLPEAEATIIREATKGSGTDEKLIFPVIVGRTNAEINILKKTYFDLYGADLAVTLNSELGGDFRKVITASLQGAVVDYNASFHTAEKAEEDADALYKAGQGRFGTDEETIIKILATAPPQHIRNVNAVYSKKYNYTLIKAVEKEFTGDAERALLYLVRMVLEPLELLAEHFESTMKGFGTDEDGLSFAIVRYACVLAQIKEAYKKKYGKELRDRIHGEVSGDMRSLLLAVFDHL
ncbi:hypothetical protein Poli38472_013294 [Pythium oligandrum]|uniref:Annexin n=1 Tax=Pythium oligandrum TaxID=41045 RepID=A0A8K1C2Y3_PYTOL|nr:hypothetical protein Poli38472_013294 [Pythium oligandrum]|eukprot:TMW55403.1 hypothetical protein Poli38472_013294 [Pythium oligandrum]